MKVTSNYSEQDLFDMGNRYIELKEQEKEVKGNVKVVNELIKDYFDATSTNELVVGNKKITRQVQDRSSMNEDMLLEKMKMLGMSEAVKLKEVVDVEVVNNLIYNGKLTPNDIADCVVNKEVVTIRISNNK